MQTGLIALELVTKMNQIPLDMRLIVREYGITAQELVPEEVLRILRNHAFKAKLKQVPFEQFARQYPLPAILFTGTALTVFS